MRHPYESLDIPIRRIDGGITMFKFKRNIFLIFFCVFGFACPSFVLADSTAVKDAPNSIVWFSNPSAFNLKQGDFWDIATGDVDGDGVGDIVMLRRGGLEWGDFKSGNFLKKGDCSWKRPAKGAKLYLRDVDNDGKLEAVISAVDDGRPSSMIFNLGHNSCRLFLDNIHISVRDLGGKSGMAGQSWASNAYFSGSVYAIKVSNDGVKKEYRLKIPRRTGLYQFLQVDGGVILQRGYSHIEMFEPSGNRFRRVWRSSKKFGGAENVLPAQTRRMLGEVSSEYAFFELPPMSLRVGENEYVIAVRHDMPVKGIVGRKPYIRGAHMVVFRRDKALGFVKKVESPSLSGAIVGWSIVPPKGGDGPCKLYVLTHDEHGYFSSGSAARILVFDIPRCSR